MKGSPGVPNLTPNKTHMIGSVNFHGICEKHGLKPEETSLHKAGCLHYGLDPEITSAHQLECAKYGLDPKKTTIAELKKAIS